MSGSKTSLGRPRFLPNGSIAYPKKGWEPPPVPPGYRRKSDDFKTSDAWVFLPCLEACKHRALNITYTICGACQIEYQCQLFGTVKVTQCLNCEEDHV